MPNVKRMAEGGNISELSDAELNRLGYSPGMGMRGRMKVQLEGLKRTRLDETKESERNLQQAMELQDALDRGEDVDLFRGRATTVSPLMKRHKAAEYKKGGLVKMASGGRVRGDGCAIKGKTKGRIV